jgi:type II secretory pathway component PulF
MKYDELAFVNLQLAAMLKDGIPLEGALKKLCETMRRGSLRAEFEKLESDLAKGMPLNDALAARNLPQFYVQMIQVGVKSNDLPGVLTMLADYYQQLSTVWLRLRALMVYPIIVLGVSLALSVFIFFVYGNWIEHAYGDLLPGYGSPSFGRDFGLWAPLVFFVFLICLFAVVISSSRMRYKLRWKLPAFREASLSQLASAISVMLRGGCNLNDAIKTVLLLEEGTVAAAELSQWQKRHEEGHSKFADMAVESKVFPPLFIWMVANAGEDLATGFRRASEVYRARALQRVEVLLQAALPVTVIFLGMVLVVQVNSFVKAMVSIIRMMMDPFDF